MVILKMHVIHYNFVLKVCEISFKLYVYVHTGCLREEFTPLLHCYVVEM